MPVFDYKCNSCGKEFDVFTGTSDSTQTPSCPECKSEDVKKSYSSFDFKIASKTRPGCGGGCCGCG